MGKYASQLAAAVSGRKPFTTRRKEPKDRSDDWELAVEWMEGRVSLAECVRIMYSDRKSNLFNCVMYRFASAARWAYENKLLKIVKK